MGDLEPNSIISSATWSAHNFHLTNFENLRNNHFQSIGNRLVRTQPFQENYTVVGSRTGTYPNTEMNTFAKQYLELQPYSHGGMRPFADNQNILLPNYTTNPIAGTGGYEPNLVSYGDQPLALSLNNMTELENRMDKEKYRLSPDDPLSATFAYNAFINHASHTINKRAAMRAHANNVLLHNEHLKRNGWGVIGGEDEVVRSKKFKADQEQQKGEEEDELIPGKGVKFSKEDKELLKKQGLNLKKMSGDEKKEWWSNNHKEHYSKNEWSGNAGNQSKNERSEMYGDQPNQEWYEEVGDNLRSTTPIPKSKPTRFPMNSAIIPDSQSKTADQNKRQESNSQSVNIPTTKPIMQQYGTSAYNAANSVSNGVSNVVKMGASAIISGVGSQLAVDHLAPNHAPTTQKNIAATVLGIGLAAADSYAPLFTPTRAPIPTVTPTKPSKLKPTVVDIIPGDTKVLSKAKKQGSIANNFREENRR